MSLLVRRIDDFTALETNRDGITGFEDIETIVSGTNLLANDTLGGFASSFPQHKKCYRKNSCSRTCLKGRSPKTPSKKAKNRLFFGI